MAKKNSQQTMKSEPAKKDESKVTSSPQKSSRLPIWKRKSDCFFILTFIGWSFALFIVFLARCEQLLPEKLNELDFAVPVCQALDTLEGPLSPLIESHEEWGKKMFSEDDDFALKFSYYVNLIFVAPLGLLLALGFFLGWNSVRNLAMIYGTLLLYNAILIDCYAFGVLRKMDILDLESVALGAVIIYGFGTFFPLALLARVWSAEPFVTKTRRRGCLATSCRFFITMGTFLWLSATAVSFYEFSVRNTTAMKSMPSVVESSRGGWEASGPAREQMLVHASVFQEWAGRTLQEVFKVTRATAVEYGERTLKWAQDMLPKEGDASATPIPKPEPPLDAPKPTATEVPKPEPVSIPKPAPPPPTPQVPPPQPPTPQPDPPAQPVPQPVPQPMPQPVPQPMPTPKAAPAPPKPVPIPRETPPPTEPQAPAAPPTPVTPPPPPQPKPQPPPPPPVTPPTPLPPQPVEPAAPPAPLVEEAVPVAAVCSDPSAPGCDATP